MKFKKALVINIPESGLDKEYWDRIDAVVEQRVHLPNDSPDLIEELKDTDCLLVNFGIDVTKEQIDAAPNLKYIGILAVAYHRVNVEYTKEKGIVVCNIAGYCTNSVAEFTIAVLLDSLRGIEEGKIRGRAGNYSEEGMSATEINGKIFAIFGLGTIGKRVAELGLGFGADVRYWSRTRKEDFEQKGIKYEDANTLLQEADFISLNLALTSETENFLNEENISKVKSDVVIINTAPMELVNMDALEKRLQKGDITFILDHSDEMSKEDLKRLSKYKNCIIYPPIAYISKEARVNKQNLFVGNVENFLKGAPTNIVN